MTSRVTTPDILGNALSPEQAERAEVAQTLRYDYSQLGEQAGVIRNHAIEIKRNERRANEAIVEAGQHLIAVKEALPHGQWEEWLDTEFHMSIRTAQTLMQIAERFDGKNEIISFLSPTVLGMLASPSVPFTSPSHRNCCATRWCRCSARCSTKCSSIQNTYAGCCSVWRWC